MANVTAIYCLKAKKDRNDMEHYRYIANLINRQIRQGGELQIQGLFEAKKNFRCENFDPYERGFSIAKGEYFLLVDGKDFDANCWRLRRACRTEKETHSAWVLTGVPASEAVYEDFFEPEQCQNPELVENKYFRQLPVDFPEYDAASSQNVCEENFISVYDIRETTTSSREDSWGVRKYTLQDFSDNPQQLEIFKQLTQCDSAESIRNVPERSVLINEILRRESTHYDDNEIYAHHSLVLAVIDGKNQDWRCGIWCYKRQKGQDVEIHEVDSLSPDGYSYDPEIGLIPVFD